MADRDILVAMTRLSGLAINTMNDETHGRLTAELLFDRISEANNLIQTLELARVQRGGKP